MTFKEKIKSKHFWLGVLIFVIAYALIAKTLILWWNYGFDFAEFRADRFFENNFFLFLLSEFVEGFIIGFIVMLISYKKRKTNDIHVTNINKST